MSMGYFCLVIAYLHLQGALTVTQEKKVSHGQQLLWNKKPIEIVGVDHVVEKVGYSNKTNVPQKPQTKNKYVGVRLSEYIGDMIKSQQSLLEKMINFNMGGMDIIEAVEKLPKETASEILTEQLPKTERASELPHEQKMEIASELLTEQLPKMMHARNNEKPAGTEMLESVLGSEQSLNGLKDAVGFIESLPPDFEQNLLDPNYKEQEMKSFPDYMYVNMEENLLLGKKHKDPEIKPLESKSDTLNKVKQNSKFSDSRDSSHSPKEKTVNEIRNHDISTLDGAAQTTTELSTSHGSEQVNQFGFAISHPDKNALKRLEETFPLVYQTIDSIPNTNEHSSTALSTHEYGQVQITKSGNQEQALHISESLTENTETHAATANHAQASQSTNMENTIIHSHSSNSLKGQVAAENVDKTPVVKVDTTLKNNEKQSVASPNEGKLFVHQHNVNEHSEGRTSPTKTFSHPNSEASSLSEHSMGLSANKVQVEIPFELDSVKSPIDVDKTLDKSVPSTNENPLPLETSQNSKLQTSDSLIMSPNEPKIESTHVRFSMKSHQAKRKTAALKKSKTDTVIVEQNTIPHQDISPEIIHGITEASSQNVQSVIPVEIGPKKHGAMTQNTAHTIAAHEIHMYPNENRVHTKHTHIMPLNTNTKQTHEKLVTAGAAFTTADHPQQITSNPNTGNTAAKRTHEMSLSPNTGHTTAKRTQEMSVSPNTGHTTAKRTQEMSVSPNTGHTTAKRTQEMSVSPNIGHTTAKRTQEMSVSPNTGHTTAKRAHEMSVSPNIGHTTAKRTHEMSVSPNTASGHTYHITVNPNSVGVVKNKHEMLLNQNAGYTTVEHAQEMSLNSNTGHTTLVHAGEVSANPKSGNIALAHGREVPVKSDTSYTSVADKILVNQKPQYTAAAHPREMSVNPNQQYTAAVQPREMSVNPNQQYTAAVHPGEMSVNPNQQYTVAVHPGEMSVNPNQQYTAAVHPGEMSVNPNQQYTAAVHPGEMSVNPNQQYTAAVHPGEMSVNPNQQYTAAVHPGEMSVNPNQQYTAAVHPREMSVNPNQQYTVAVHPDEMSVNPNQQYTAAVHPHEMSVNPNQQYTAAVHPGEILVNPKPYQTTAVDTHEVSVNPHSGFISRGGHAGQISVNPNSESNSAVKMSVNPDTGFTVAANTQEMSMNQQTGNPVMERTNKVSMNLNSAAGNTRQVTQNPNTSQIAAVHSQEISVNQNIGSDATKHTKASLLSHGLSTGTDKTHDSYDKTKFTAYIPTLPKRLNLDHQSYESVETNLPNTKQNNLHSENHFLDGRFLGNIHEPQNAFVENAQSFIFKGTNGENNKSSVGKAVKAITHTIGIDKVTSAREDPLLIEQNPAFSKETFGTHLLHRDTKRYDSPNILGETNRNSEIMSNLNNQIEEKTSTISLTVPENKGEVLSAKLSNKVKNRISFSYKKKTAERGVQSATNENSKNANFSEHTGVVMKTGSVVLKGKTEAGTVSAHKQVHDANSMATRTNTYHGSGKGEFFGKLRQLSKIDIDVTKGPLFTDSITENIKQENKPTETVVSHNEANTPMIGGSISGTVSGAVASYGPQGAESGFSHSTKPHVPVIDISYDQNNMLSSSTNPRAKALATGSTGSFSNDAMISADNALVQEKYSSSSQKMSPYGNQFNSLKGHVQSISSQSATNHLNIEASNSQFEMNISPSGISQNVKVDSHKDTNFDLSKKGKRNVSIELLKPAQKEIQLGEKHQMDEILSTHRKGQDKNSGEANPKEQKLIQTSEYISNSVTQKDKLGGIQKPATYNAKSRKTAYSDKSLSVDSIKVTDISDRMVDTNAKYSTEPQKLGGDISLNGNVKVRVKQSPMEKIKNSVSESLESLSVSKTSNRASISESKDKKTLVNTGSTSYEKKQKADKKENKSKFTRHIKSTSKGPSNKSIQGKGKISKLSLHSGGKMNSTISGTKRKTVRKYTSSTRKHIPNFLSLPRSRKAKSLLVAVLSGLKKRGLKIRNFAALKKIVSAIKILAARLQARKKLRPVITKPIVYTHYLDDDDDNDTNEIDDNDDIPTHPNNV